MSLIILVTVFHPTPAVISMKETEPSGPNYTVDNSAFLYSFKLLWGL